MTRERANLSPGGLFCGDHSFIVSTLLGSCVATCLWDRRLRLGGMNHFLLPRWNGAGAPLRFGDAAIDRLVAELEAMGAKRADLQAKIFGGAAVLGSGKPGGTVGEMNVAMAVSRLKHHHIPLVGRSTGGAYGCMIRFDLNTGEVALRRVVRPSETAAACGPGCGDAGQPCRLANRPRPASAGTGR